MSTGSTHQYLSFTQSPFKSIRGRIECIDFLNFPILQIHGPSFSNFTNSYFLFYFYSYYFFAFIKKKLQKQCSGGKIEVLFKVKEKHSFSFISATHICGFDFYLDTVHHQLQPSNIFMFLLIKSQISLQTFNNQTYSYNGEITQAIKMYLLVL